MAQSKRIYSPSVRKRKAYSTAFRVFFSYLWLNFKSKIFGQRYYNKRITALHLKNADRIKIRIQELQGLFIKFGQLISNLSNVLPAEFRAPLEELQDHIQAKPFSEIKESIQEQLGDDPDNIFSAFNHEPLAAASIGQVHRATVNGEEVVVKIQHKNIETIAKADLTILKNLVRLHGYFMDMQGLEHTYDQVAQMIREELDYKLEAEHMVEIGKNIEGNPSLSVRVPKVFSEFSSAKILTTEYCEGIKIGNIDQIENWNIDQIDLSKRLIELYCQMVLVDGYYHADPHPGNILVNKFGEIIILDFGAVARLSSATKKAIPELIEAIVKGDDGATVQALKQMGFLGSDKDSKKFVKRLIAIFKEFIETEVELDGLNFQNVKLNSGLSSLAGIIQKINLKEVSNTIRIPKDYILLNRTVVLLLGNAFNLAPALNPLDVVQPYIKQHVMNKDNGFTQLVINSLKNQITTAISLPNELSSFIKESKELDLKEELRGVKKILRKIYFLLQQIFFAGLLFGLLYLLPKTAGLATPEWFNVIYFGGSGIVVILLLRSIYRNNKL